MINRFMVVLTAGALLINTGCQDRGTGEIAGGLVGAGLGAYAGSQIGHGTTQLIATAGGAVLGAWLGSELGRTLDGPDRNTASNNAYQALEYNRDGQASYWSNPNNSTSGYTQPNRSYASQQYGYCRDYESVVTVNGKRELARGTACRQPDGTWRVVS